MENKRFDTKTVFIFVLAGALILSLIFRPSKKIDDHKDKLKQLEEINKGLLNDNEKLKDLNEDLFEDINDLLEKVDSISYELEDSKRKIKDLEDAKGSITDYTSGLNADGIAKSLSEYLNKKR